MPFSKSNSGVKPNSFCARSALNGRRLTVRGQVPAALHSIGASGKGCAYGTYRVAHGSPIAGNIKRPCCQCSRPECQFNRRGEIGHIQPIELLVAKRNAYGASIARRPQTNRVTRF